MFRISFAFLCVLFSLVITAQESDIPPDSDVIKAVITEKSGETIETRITVENDNGKAKLVFTQETENGFIFKSVHWKGDVSLLLSNGETIRLKDSKMKGSSIQRGGYIGGFMVPDIYQRYAAFYLTDEQCEKLKKNSVMLVSYTLDDKYDKDVHYIEVDVNNNSLKYQLSSIGK